MGMSVKIWLWGLVVVSTLAVTKSQLLQYIVHLRSEDGSIQGTVTFTQDTGPVSIFGKITGLDDGLHALHVHETGDLSGGCESTLNHYNPSKMPHGGRKDPERHVGDLGNIMVHAGLAEISITDNIMNLRGPYMILGRSLVVHEDPDDQGRGGYPDSITTGHSGRALACGVIGLLTPIDKMYDLIVPSSAVSLLPLKTLLLPLLAILRLNY